MGANGLTRIKGKQGDACAGLLGQGQADHLAGLVGHLLAQGKGLCVGDILNQRFHNSFLLVV